MKRKPGKKYENIIFDYSHYPIKGSEYSHPVIRIMKLDPQYPTCSPDTLFEITGQCDSRNGFSFRKSYSLKCEMSLDNYYLNTSLKMLNALGFGKDDYPPRNMMELFKKIRSLRIPRYVIETVDSSNGYDKKEFVPREFKNKAALY